MTTIVMCGRCGAVARIRTGEAQPLHYGCVNCSAPIAETGLCDTCTNADTAGHHRGRRAGLQEAVVIAKGNGAGVTAGAIEAMLRHEERRDRRRESPKTSETPSPRQVDDRGMSCHVSNSLADRDSEESAATSDDQAASAVLAGPGDGPIGGGTRTQAAAHHDKASPAGTAASPRSSDNASYAPGCGHCSHPMLPWQVGQWQCAMSSCPRFGIVVTGPVARRPSEAVVCADAKPVPLDPALMRGVETTPIFNIEAARDALLVLVQAARGLQAGKSPHAPRLAMTWEEASKHAKVIHTVLDGFDAMVIEGERREDAAKRRGMAADSSSQTTATENITDTEEHSR